MKSKKPTEEHCYDWWNMMNLHSLSLKTDCINTFSIPKLSEKNQFQCFNKTYDWQK